MDIYWHKQTPGKPLFPDLLWSRPENRLAAGKLLIIGGNRYGFAAVGEAYAAAQTAGAGVVRVLLPDALRKTVGHIFETVELAPSTPSGSFSQKALTGFLTAAAWADGILVAGDLGRNSETAIVLEKFVEKYSGQLTLTKDAVDYFTAAPKPLLARGNATLVLSFAQLQKLATGARFARAFTFGMNLIPLVEALHGFTAIYPAAIVTRHLDTMFVSVSGQVSSTQLAAPPDSWRVRTAAAAGVWQMQNPAKPFEALTTAVAGSFAP